MKRPASLPARTVHHPPYHKHIRDRLLPALHRRDIVPWGPAGLWHIAWPSWAGAMATRRSTRQTATASAVISADHDDDDAGEASSAGGSSHDHRPTSDEDSADEWQPKAATVKGRLKRVGSESASSGSELDLHDGRSESHTVAGKEQKGSKRPRQAPPKDVATRQSARSSADSAESDDEEEQERQRKEAEDAWAEVRARKKASAEQGPQKQSKAAQGAPTTEAQQQKQPKGTLNSWLGLPPIDWPVAPESARVTDRESLFVGFAYPIAASSTAAISQRIQHLGSVVHPTLPASIFPSAFSHLDPKRRGASHDMHAWRVLELKRGRDGLGGPNDYGLEEGHDDDGERWGGEKILRAMKEMGAVDLLVVVSRWYGGTNLGPARFDHILQCAREAIRAHMTEETVAPLRSELSDLDSKISSLRSQLAGAPDKPDAPQSSNSTVYQDLDVDKARRLVNARQKTIELLTKRLANRVESTELDGVADRGTSDRLDVAKVTDPTAAVVPLASSAAERRGSLPQASSRQQTAEPSQPADPTSIPNEGAQKDDLDGWDDLI
ncbi:unnamed protein product [Parajaminaea phylloscopi]